MVGISVGDNESIDKALKRFKKKYERSGVLKEFKKRTFFVKPSIKKRMEKLKAVRRAHRLDQND
ncbi:MAG: 30S ribosomal protein S21 [Ignavibacteriaceae bacterium]|nr:30S ribosomal protein S21 [Ignavibacteriaceae bacterium]